MKRKKIKRIVMVPVKFYIDADSEEAFLDAVERAKKTWHSSSSFGGPGKTWHLDSEEYLNDNEHRRGKGFVDYAVPGKGK